LSDEFTVNYLGIFINKKRMGLSNKQGLKRGDLRYER
jgi:hypothetical protein